MPSDFKREMDFCQCIPTLLSNAFEKLGRFVATHPVKIIIVSLISSIFMSVGIFTIGISKDIGYLTAPINCRAYEEERTINQLFPMDQSTNYDYYRITKIGSFSALIVLSKDQCSVVNAAIFKEAIEMDQMIRSFQIEWKGNMYNYSNICAKNMGQCYNNHVLSYIDRVNQTEVSIKYPIEVDMSNMQFSITGIGFGGVTLGSMRQLTDAKALRLLYFLDASDKSKQDLLLKWQREFDARISKIKSNKAIFVKFSTSYFSEEFWKLAIVVLKYGTIGIMLLTTCCVLTTMTSDWITCKPLLAISGCISSGLAVIASFAMMSLVGVPFIAFNVTVLFLTAGIGVDDMFILIAAWRKTDRSDSVTNRMGKTYYHAALSITMTSLTNLIAFVIGATIPIPMIRNFCIQAVFAIAFDYIYQLTFFGGCMALDGYREEKGLHPVTFKPLIPRKDAANKSWIYRMLFTSKSENNGLNPPKLMVWFGDSLGQWINKRRSKSLILIIFVIYLSGATWGITTLKEGMEFEDFYSDDSDAYLYAKMHYRYFNNYIFAIQVAVTDKLDYSNRTVQRGITKAINRFHKNKHISTIDLNWLKHYLLFARYFSREVRGYNLSDPKGFNSCLRDVFFQSQMGEIYKNDVVFDNDGIHVIASRFILFANGVSKLSDEGKLANDIRLMADSLPYSVTVQSIWWLYYELAFVIQQLTVQTITVAISATIFVFFFLTDNFFSVVCVAICIISIVFGGIGYMAAFGITLNFASTLALVVSVGLCVDNSAHVLCAFQLAKGEFNARIEQTLFSVGMPILQGSFTTFIALLPVLIVENRMFRVMIILIVLEITFSALHAIFLVPTILSGWEAANKCFRRSLTEENKGNKTAYPPISTIDSSRL